jgi:hypothetical protein
MNPNQAQAIRILRSWHMVEFFQSYNLPDKADPNLQHIRLSLDELARQREAVMPWLDPRACEQLGIPDNRTHGFILYLGVFDKSVINNVCEHCFGNETNPNKALEFEERFDPKADTCFAKLILDPWGNPDLIRMSVSTLPWALGHLLGDTLDELTLESFDQRCELLAQFLDRLAPAMPAHPQNPNTRTLDAHSLYQLLNELYSWADFTPGGEFSFILDWYEIKSKKRSDNTLADPSQDAAALDNSPDYSADYEQPQMQRAQGSLSDERLMPILNSFYIEDIERVINSINNGSCQQALMDYLCEKKNKHADLYTNQGLALIIKNLAPAMMPPGRWPGEPAHAMSLMQQFAINTAFDELKDQGLLSVNGPPGTGKTTLLRDVVSQNIVARAKVLAELDKPTDGITEQGFPIEALTGFEMVVASSNNLAVENISKELPLLSSIADEFAHLDHYKSVANQLNALKTKKGYQPLSADEQCWGLLCAVLGRQKNRANFVESFFFDCHFNKGSQEEAQRPKEFDILNFYQWIRLQPAPDFNLAKKAFKDQLNAFETQISQLQSMDDLKVWFTNNPRIKFLAKFEQEQKQARTQLTTYEDQLTKVVLELPLAFDTVEIETLKMADAQAHGIDLNATRKRLIEAKQQLNQLQRNQITLHSTIEQCQQSADVAAFELAEAEQEYTKKQLIFTTAQNMHSSKKVPDSTSDISDPNLQRTAFWQDENLNRMRSELLVAALKLHQAWLGAALRHQPFFQALYRIKNVLRGQEIEDAKAHWQMLFLLVPVVSTTFASLGRMFKSLKAGDLGWLMIDEAGQAVPQAAVGAIWRAKRVIVVGDPLQIEPVFTTPPKLSEALCQTVLGKEASQWDPQLWSVQQISDRANAYGCQLDTNQRRQWVGIPLWVHRRCIEPMFSIANNIAYDGRMIHGSPTDEIQARQHAALGNNHWQVSQGFCTIKQYKSELGRDTLSLLYKLAQSGQNLNDVYIITPFRAVKQQLIQTVGQHKDTLCQLTGFSFKQFYQWRRRHIGTVHTFQGKENGIVILVLGCDVQNFGGATWASSKPNLLNVALTRAREHIFVIGDPDVWQGRNYFSQLADVLGFVE